MTAPELRHLDAGGGLRSSRTRACRRTSTSTVARRTCIAGKDPQLEKAIELALEALKKNPPKKDDAARVPEAGRGRN